MHESWYPILRLILLLADSGSIFARFLPKIKARYDHSQLHFIGRRTDNLFTVVYQINPQLGTRTTILFLKVSNACYNKASENPCQMETAHGLFGFRYRAMKCYGVEALNGWLNSIIDMCSILSIDIKNMEAHVNSFVFIQWNKAQPDSREHLKAPCMNLAVESSRFH